MHDKLIIGWREYVVFPEWGDKSILAKADTGARSSAIDVANIQELPGNRVRFDVVLSRANRDEVISVEEDIVRRGRVRSSNGMTTERFVVSTTIQIGRVKKTVELGLVSRKRMLCRVLLGRQALSDDFVVDSLHKYIFGRPKRAKKKRKKTRKKEG